MLVAGGDRVTVASRNRCHEEEMGRDWFYFDLTHLDTAADRLRSQCSELSDPIDLLVYAAGSRQEETFTAMLRQKIEALIAVNFTAPMLILKHILNAQRKLPGVIIVTSTSQATARQGEEIYCATKAGLRMFAESASLSGNVQKMLVAAPGGMNTPFWAGSGKDTSDFLNPKNVAASILDHYDNEAFTYCELEIPRNGPLLIRKER